METVILATKRYKAMVLCQYYGRLMLRVFKSGLVILATKDTPGSWRW